MTTFLVLMFLIPFILLCIFAYNRYKINTEKEVMRKHRLTGKWFYMKTSTNYILKVQKIKDDDTMSYFKANPEEINILTKYKYM